MCNDEIKRKLISFYEYSINGNVNVEQALGEFDLDTIVERSIEYRDYKEADMRFEELKQDILAM